MTKLAEALPVLDHEALEKLTGYQSGTQSLIDALFVAFEESAAISLRELKEGWAKRDVKSMAQAAHRLKSTSSTLGLSRVTALCKKIEKANDLLPDMPTVLEDLEMEMNAAREALFGKIKG